MTVRNISPRALTIPALLLFLLGIAVETADAQSPVNPGQRVRATMLNGGQIVGTVVSVSESESMTVRTQLTMDGGSFRQGPMMEGQTVDVVFSEIRQLELSAGMQSGIKRGAMWGGIGGVVLGGLLGATSGSGAAAAYLGLGGGLTGALNGLWIGHVFLGGERWRPAPAFLGSGRSLVLAPQSGRSGVAIGLRVPLGR